jgi:hypothetical protein
MTNNSGCISKDEWFVSNNSYGGTQKGYRDIPVQPAEYTPILTVHSLARLRLGPDSTKNSSLFLLSFSAERCVSFEDSLNVYQILYATRLVENSPWLILRESPGVP